MHDSPTSRFHCRLLALGLLVTSACGTTTPTVAAGSKLETGIGLTMIRVAAGKFYMGSPESEAGRDGDELRHEVELTEGFWLGQTEVTQGQWRAVMGTEPWKGLAYEHNHDRVAATYVSHDDALEFCRKLTEREREAGRLPDGHRFTLPTEAEWEFATRAGSDSPYPSGDDASELRAFAVYPGARDGEHAHAVKGRRPNAWGFYDLIGNVSEWCADSGASKDGVVTNTYTPGVVDPLGLEGPLRVHRGGSWYSPASGSRPADRSCATPDHADFRVGFRPVLTRRQEIK